MKRLALALALVVVTAGGPGEAHAGGTTFVGGCGMAVTVDTTPSGVLGGPQVWNGVVYLDVVATDPAGVPNADPVTAWCEVTVNGVSQGNVIAPRSGLGAVFDADRVTYTAYRNDDVQWCAHVSTPSNWDDVKCGPPTVASLDLSALDDVLRIVNGVVGTAVTEVNGVYALLLERVHQLDPTTCGQLIGVADPVDRIFNPNFLFIDQNSGDVYFNGTREWDCPPYVA